MRYPVHGRPPTFAEHGDGVIVGVKIGVVIRLIASRGLSGRAPKGLTVQGLLAEREGFEPSIRVTPDTARWGSRWGSENADVAALVPDQTGRLKDPRG
jgi:hypothetical protein